MAEADNVVQLPWADSFVNLLAGLGVVGRDKFASQTYTLTPMSVVDLENAYRGDWIARKVVTIPAWDMTREWRTWQADPDQITTLENLEKKLFVQQKLQQALIKSRLYGGAAIIIGVDVGNPEEELDLELVTIDSLKFIHVVSKNNIRAGPIIHDISSKYYGQPEFYEARQEPVSKSFKQAVEPGASSPNYNKTQIKVHPSRVVKLIGTDTADQMLQDIWGDSVLQAVNDSVKMCGLVTGSLATLIAELKVDVIKIPELKSILSTDAGTRKVLARFSAANAAKSTVNTILIDGNEEWERIQASLVGVPDVLMTYLQIAAGASDIPATRFLGMSPKGLNATGESDIRNYYDRLAAEQTTILTPTINVLDEVLIRSALGDRPPEVWYEWKSLWQLTAGDKADIALKKAQTYQIDVNAAQIPTTALANARVNQLIEDGTYPGLEQAIDDAAAEGDTIEEHNAAPELPPEMLAQQPAPPPGQPGGPPAGQQPPAGGNVVPFQKAVAGDASPDFDDECPLCGGRHTDLEDFNKCHNEHGEEGGQFCSDPSSGGGGKETGREGDPKKGETHEGKKQTPEEKAKAKAEKAKAAAAAKAAHTGSHGAKGQHGAGKHGGLGALGHKGEKKSPSLGATGGGKGEGKKGTGTGAGAKGVHKPKETKAPKAPKAPAPKKEKAGKKGPGFQQKTKGGKGKGQGKGQGKGKGPKPKKEPKPRKPKAPPKQKQPKQQKPPKQPKQKQPSAKQSAAKQKAAAKLAKQVTALEKAISEEKNPERRARLERQLERLRR